MPFDIGIYEKQCVNTVRVKPQSDKELESLELDKAMSEFEEHGGKVITSKEELLESKILAKIHKMKLTREAGKK